MLRSQEGMQLFQLLLSHGVKNQSGVAFKPAFRPHYYNKNLETAIRKLEADPRGSMARDSTDNSRGQKVILPEDPRCCRRRITF